MPKSHVYWNLHKSTWSIRQGGKVAAHATAVLLDNVEFRVQPAGRERVRKEGKKNVHAFAVGDLSLAADFDLRTREIEAREITYNPYKYDSFVYADDLTPVGKCDRVYLYNRKVWEVLDA